MKNAIYRIDRYTHTLCDLGVNQSLFSQFSNLSYLIFGEFRLSVCSAFMRVLTILCNHVGIIVGFSAKKQMVGVYTRTHIALVQYAQIIGNWAIRNFKRYDVSTARATPTGDLPVSMVIRCTRPQPTRIRLLDIMPKAVNERPNKMTLEGDKWITVFTETLVMSVAQKAGFNGKFAS